MTHEHDTTPQDTPLRTDPPEDPALPPYVPLGERRAARLREHETTLDAARAEMAAMIQTPPDTVGTLESMLVRQSHILNDLFRKSLVAHAAPSLSGLGMALSLQRECRQTVQALARVRRVNELTDRGAIDETGKRTDSPDRLYDATGRLIYDFGKKY